MIYLDGHPALLPDTNRFVHSLEKLIRLRSHVSDVHAAVGRHRLRDLDELLGAGKVARRIYQRCPKPECSVLHRSANGRTHGIERRAGGRAHMHAHRIFTQRAGTDERADIRRNSVGLHGAKPGVKSMRAEETLRRRDRGRSVGRDVGDRNDAHGCCRVSLAKDLGRHPLRQFPDVAAVAVQKLFAGMSLYVDEARRNHQSGSVDAPACASLIELAPPRNRGDPVSPNTDIPVKPRVASAINDPSIGDDNVVRRLRHWRRDISPRRHMATRRRTDHQDERKNAWPSPGHATGTIAGPAARVSLRSVSESMKSVSTVTPIPGRSSGTRTMPSESMVHSGVTTSRAQ